MRACLKLLSIPAIMFAILFMSTIGVEHSAEISKMANTMGAKGTELKLTDTAESSNGKFDCMFGTATV